MSVMLEWCPPVYTVLTPPGHPRAHQRRRLRHGVDPGLPRDLRRANLQLTPAGHRLRDARILALPVERQLLDLLPGDQLHQHRAGLLYPIPGGASSIVVAPTDIRSSSFVLLLTISLNL